MVSPCSPAAGIGAGVAAVAQPAIATIIKARSELRVTTRNAFSNILRVMWYVVTRLAGSYGDPAIDARARSQG